MQDFSPQHWFERGLELAKSSQFLEAIRCYDRALAMNPENESEILNQKARALSHLDRYGEAVECLKQVVRENPNDREANLWLGIMEHQWGDYRAAYRNYDRTENSNDGCLFAAIGLFSAIGSTSRQNAFTECIESQDQTPKI